MTAPIRSMPGLLRTQAEMVEAYRARIRELNISYATVDAISGLPDGYTAKLMSPKPMKGLGEKAIEGLNGALGIAFTVTVDPDQVQRVQGRWERRKRAIDKKKQLLLRPLSIPLSIDHEVPKQIIITADLHRQIVDPEHMRALGRLGGKARLTKLSRRQRKAIARKAILTRWRKVREAAAVRC